MLLNERPLRVLTWEPRLGADAARLIEPVQFIDWCGTKWDRHLMLVKNVHLTALACTERVCVARSFSNGSRDVGSNAHMNYPSDLHC